MAVNPFGVVWLCVFTLKLFGLIDMTWWIVAPMAFLSAMCMTAEREK
jgi:hypothetical protein